MGSPAGKYLVFLIQIQLSGRRESGRGFAIYMVSWGVVVYNFNLKFTSVVVYNFMLFGGADSLHRAAPLLLSVFTTPNVIESNGRIKFFLTYGIGSASIDLRTHGCFSPRKSFT